MASRMHNLIVIDDSDSDAQNQNVQDDDEESTCEILNVARKPAHVDMHSTESDDDSDAPRSAFERRYPDFAAMHTRPMHRVTPLPPRRTQNRFARPRKLYYDDSDSDDDKKPAALTNEDPPSDRRADQRHFIDDNREGSSKQVIVAATTVAAGRKSPPRAASKTIRQSITRGTRIHLDDDDSDDNDSDDALVSIRESGGCASKKPQRSKRFPTTPPVKTKRAACGQDDSDSDLSLAAFCRKYPASPLAKTPSNPYTKNLQTKSCARKTVIKPHRKRKRQTSSTTQKKSPPNGSLKPQAQQVRVDESKLLRGYYADREVCVLVDPMLLQRRRDTFVSFHKSPKTKSFPIVEQSGINERAVQFIRRSYLDGGAEAAKTALEENRVADFEVVDRLLVVFDTTNDFLILLGGGDDSFPELIDWLQSVKEAWRMRWKRNSDPTVVILLHHEASTSPGSNSDDDDDGLIYDAISFLSILHRVDCIPCANLRVMMQILQRMTISISKVPYTRPTTEVECMRKFSKKLARSQDRMERVQDTWYRMLCIFPQMSADRAQRLIQHYPTMHSLREAYQDPDKTVEEKEQLVANLFDDRQHRKLSTQLYRVMTSQNRNELIV